MVPGNNRIYQGKKSKSNLNLLTKGTSEVSAVLIGLGLVIQMYFIQICVYVLANMALMRLWYTRYVKKITGI